uniref:Hsp90 chaperone protein kinase-targeting subunit n=1 Tax=Plectus sambesii TaxID=2011161 RepID=A0A914UT87_9BILA
MLTMQRDFFNKYDEDMKKYGQQRGFDASEKFLLDNPHLACDFTANYLTLECLNLGMEFKDEEMCTMAEQCIIVQYLIELAKTLNMPPTNTSVIHNFFRKFKAADPSYLKMFRSEVEAFQDRIRKRAKDKRDAAIAEMEKEEREKRIAASPGGVDPQEVYESLPEKMREAFDSQEVSQLQKVAEEMDKEEFSFHLQRCIASGLWVPDANKPNAFEQGDQSDQAEKEQPDDATETPEPKKDR